MHNVRKHFFNEDYFKEINTDDKAYWLGFISADGHVSSSNKNTKSLRLIINIHQKDIHLLEKFKKDIGADSIKIRKYINDKTPMCSIVLNSNTLGDSLIKLGITRNKTYHMNIPNIKNELLSSYLLGYFDGDGFIGMYPRKENPNRFRYSFEIVSASECIVADIQKYLKNNDISTHIYIRQPKGISKYCTYRLITSSKVEIKKIRELMYKKNVHCLDRKKEIFDKIIN